MSLEAITLIALHGEPVDVAQVQRVLDAAPRYARLTTGLPPTPDAAQRLFAALPAGHARAGKHVFAIHVGARAVGCIDLLRGYPTPDTAYIGLLLLAETDEGRGLGRAAYARLEAWLQGWPECRRVRLGVLETNTRARIFWQRLGFAATGETRTHRSGTVDCAIILLAKPLPDHR